MMQSIIKTINDHETFLISTHVNPDPDALCSQLALAQYIQSLGKCVIMLNEDVVPQRFEFFPGSKKIKAVKNVKKVSYDVAIIVDCGELERIGKVKNFLDRDKVLVNIDHHITNTKFGSLNLVDVKASSTAEVIFEFFKKAGFVFTDKTALCLYTGIMTDTGSFRFENTSSRTFKIAADLKKYKFSADKIFRRIYESIPVEDMLKFVKVISRVEPLFDGAVICMSLPKRVVEGFSLEFDLRDAIFKFLRSIKGVEVFVILTEVSSEMTRVNFRSAQYVDVALLASNFKGGGHKRASGCKVDANLSKSRLIILKEVKKLLS